MKAVLLAYLLASANAFAPTVSMYMYRCIYRKYYRSRNILILLNSRFAYLGPNIYNITTIITI